ncbi:MAG: DNA translocase FtsK 4TM domain-containing protein, partial [Pseudomonadota bacterium]|nr:DNA translocase FtsK 4TM domain-containing protein [Pseudomonadota bacterium]
MSRSHSAALPEHSNRSALSAFLFRQIFALAGFALFLLLVLAVAALATWNVSDPSLSYATDNPPTNILGLPGSVFADLMMQFFGLGSLLALLPVLAWSFALIGGRQLNRIPARLGAWLAGALVAAAAVGCFPPPSTWPLPSGTGGVLGDLILRFPALFIGAYPTSTFAMALGSILAVPATWLMLFASGIVGKPIERLEDDEPVAPVARRKAKEPVFEDEDEEDEPEGPIAL